MKISEAVAKRTKDLLKVKNMTKYRLTKITCLSKNAINKLLNNENKDVKLSTIRLIAEAFGMTLSEFFNDEIFNFNNIDY